MIIMINEYSEITRTVILSDWLVLQTSTYNQHPFPFLAISFHVETSFGTSTFQADFLHTTITDTSSVNDKDNILLFMLAFIRPWNECSRKRKPFYFFRATFCLPLSLT